MYVYTITQSSLWISYTNILRSVLGMESMPITSTMGCSKMPGRSIDSLVPQGTERCESPKSLPQNTYMFFWYQKLKMENSLVIIHIVPDVYLEHCFFPQIRNPHTQNMNLTSPLRTRIEWSEVPHLEHGIM